MVRSPGRGGWTVGLQELYYLSGILGASGGLLLILWRSYRRSLDHLHQRVEDLKALTVSRVEFKEAMEQLIERSDGRWDDHLKYGEEVLRALRERIELLQKSIDELRRGPRRAV